jgi:hypothetical protein
MNNNKIGQELGCQPLRMGKANLDTGTKSPPAGRSETPSRRHDRISFTCQKASHFWLECVKFKSTFSLQLPDWKQALVLAMQK